MRQHTPGPWVVVENDIQVFVACSDPMAEYICEAMGGYRTQNAALIAAAPETRAKLDELLEAAGTVIQHIADAEDVPIEDFMQLMRAIAKAKGEPS